MRARDTLIITAERCGDHLAVICQGHDRTASRFAFEVDPVTMRDNLRAQLDWAAQVELVNRLLNAYLGQGVSVDVAWTMITPLLPASLVADTSWRSGPVPPNCENELLQGEDDVLGDAVDPDAAFDGDGTRP